MKFFYLFLSIIFLIIGMPLIVKHQQIFYPHVQNSSAPHLAAKHFMVGYQVKKVNYAVPTGATKTLTFAIWYPTTTEGTYYSYNRHLSPGGIVAKNAPLAKTGTLYPLIVLSHGAGGCGTGYTYLTQYLASYGYVVAAPDHEDAKICTIEGGFGSGKVTNININDRAADINEVIKEMLLANNQADSTFYQGIDKSTAGVFGHSAGGETAMQVSGLVAADKNPLIKATLLLAPDTGMYPQSAYAQMIAPLMELIGQYDTKAVTANNTPRYIPFVYASAPKYVAYMEKDWHLVFDDTACVGYRSINDCQEKNKRVMDILNYSGLFFNAYLKHDKSALAVLADTNFNLGNRGSTCYAYQMISGKTFNDKCDFLSSPQPAKK